MKKPLALVIRCSISDKFEFLNFHSCRVQGAVNPSNVLKSKNVSNQKHLRGGPRQIFWEDKFYALGTAGAFIHDRNFW